MGQISLVRDYTFGSLRGLERLGPCGGARHRRVSDGHPSLPIHGTFGWGASSDCGGGDQVPWPVALIFLGWIDSARVFPLARLGAWGKYGYRTCRASCGYSTLRADTRRQGGNDCVCQCRRGTLGAVGSLAIVAEVRAKENGREAPGTSLPRSNATFTALAGMVPSRSCLFQSRSAAPRSSGRALGIRTTTFTSFLTSTRERSVSRSALRNRGGRLDCWLGSRG